MFSCNGKPLQLKSLFYQKWAVPNKYIPDLHYPDLYSYYYGHVRKEPLEKYAKKMKGVKLIQERL